MMKRFYTAIVRRRRLVLAVFALAAVLSMAATRAVQVDYDINDYLPPESPSTTAIEVMNGAFTGGIPNMRVMVRDVTVPQALDSLALYIDTTPYTGYSRTLDTAGKTLDQQDSFAGFENYEFFALDDVSFDIMPGDFYGLIGLNGSGKSTLLKVISGVYKPSAGRVTVNGTIAPLIELGAGFDMDLTARENIYLNGTVLGYTPKYIDSKFDDIVEFSELQDFLDVPLKNYSSGMVARLAFAVATMTKPDILIADEILSVGDFLFQEKCEKRMAELLSGGTTVILVSHGRRLSSFRSVSSFWYAVTIAADTASSAFCVCLRMPPATRKSGARNSHIRISRFSLSMRAAFSLCANTL